MGRRLSCAIACLTIVFAVRGELVKNGGFEEGTAQKAMGWSLAPCYSIQDGAGMNGNRGLVFTNDVPNRKVGFCQDQAGLCLPVLRMGEDGGREGRRHGWREGLCRHTRHRL